MTTDLALIEQVQSELAELPRFAALVRENLGSDGITAQNLTRIRVPAGGGLAFEYPTPQGVEPRPTFTGIILHRQNARAFWREGLDAGGGNAPPDCRSDDGITGVGDPGGDCSVCPFAQYGSKDGSSAQACKLVNQIFTKVPGEGLPVVVVAPPGSLRPVRDYMLRLTSMGTAYWSAITRFALESTKNAGGIKYSRLQLTRLAELDGPSAAMVADARVQMAPLFGTVEVHAADVG